MSKIVGIIQARLGSTRLPSKTLAEIEAKPLLEHIVLRISAARTISDIVIATTNQAQDDPIVLLAKRLSVKIFRGSEKNVLSRFYEAAKALGADIIVRVTADDPFKDPEIIDKAVFLLQNGGYDYCSNTLKPTYPEGLDVEVFTFAALESAFLEAKLDSDKEHVTPFIWKRPERYSLHNFMFEPDLSSLRWTIDYEKDLLFAREVYEQLYSRKPLFLMNDILDLLDREPALSQMNAGVSRNEGYHASLKKEEEHG